MCHGSKQHLPLRAGSARRAALLGAATAVASSMASEEAQAFGKNPSDWLGYYKDRRGLKIRLVNAWFTCVLPVYYLRTKKGHIVRTRSRLGASTSCSPVKDPQHPMCPRKIKYDPAAAPWSAICSKMLILSPWKMRDGCFVKVSPPWFKVWESHPTPTWSLNTLNFERFMLKFVRDNMAVPTGIDAMLSQKIIWHFNWGLPSHNFRIHHQ